jgi:hypothetical protein
MEIRNEFGRWGRVEAEIPYECVKEITRTLRKTYKGISSHSFGYCCSSDYDCYHKNCNEDDFVDAKIFKGGMNNQYHDGRFDIGNCVWFMWKITNFDFDNIIDTMNTIAHKYNCEIKKPQNDAYCIELRLAPTEEDMCRLYMALMRKRYYTDEPKEISMEDALQILKSNSEIQIEIMKLFN